MDIPQSIIIRSAIDHDLETLVGFSAALAIETEGRHLNETLLRAGISELLKSPRLGSFFVAEIPGVNPCRTVGQVMITYEWSDWRNATFWWLQSVYVDPSWRRRGIYRSMYHYIVTQAKREANVCGIRLYVEQSNKVAQSVYQQVGLSSAGYLVYEEDFVINRHQSAPGLSEESGNA